MKPALHYPVSLIVQGRRCLVVGGGPVGRRKAEGLLACEALVHLVATRVDPETKSLAGLTWEERPYRSGEAGGYSLVIAATGDAAIDGEVHRDAEEAGRWVNVADNPALCSFTLPSVLRQGPLSVAISTGGASPALAAWLRRRLEAEIGPEHAVLAELLSSAREALKAQGRSTEGLDWQGALDSGMLSLVRAGRIEAARERLESCLSSP